MWGVCNQHTPHFYTPMEMKQTLEIQFFQSICGILKDCFSWIAHKYDLGFYASQEHEKKPKKHDERSEVYYTSTLPKRIHEDVEVFYNTYGELPLTHPLMTEVENNIDEVRQSQDDLQRYVFDLLMPFKEFSDKLYPTKDLNNQYRNERAKYVSQEYFKILHMTTPPDGTVEDSFQYLWSIVNNYGCSLDTLLIKRGIDLMQYQNQCGIFLFPQRDIIHLSQCYFGDNMKLLKIYLNKLLSSSDSTKTNEQTITPVAQETAVKRTKTIRDIIQYHDPDKLLKRLHEMIDSNGQAAAVGAIFLNAFYIKGYLLGKPTPTQFHNEFPDCNCKWDAIRKYMNENNQTAVQKANKIIIFVD